MYNSTICYIFIYLYSNVCLPALQDNMPSGKLNEMDEPPTRWQPRNDSHGCINRCGEGTGGICVEDSVGWKVGKLALVQREIMKYNTAQGHFAGSDSYLSIFLVFHPKAQVDHVQSLEIAGSLSWGSLVILERNLPGVPAWFVSGSCPARTRASGGQCDCSKGTGSRMCGSFLEFGSRFRKCAMTTLLLRTSGILCRIPVFTERTIAFRKRNSTTIPSYLNSRMTLKQLRTSAHVLAEGP